jgi:protein-disulfide isomerase-like protein with CxxC motif
MVQKHTYIQNRAYKEAQRNTKTASQDLNNSIAESNDRRVRLDEVMEVFMDCKARAAQVESDQRLLRDLMTKGFPIHHCFD